MNPDKAFLADIPKQFYSEESGALFQNCLNCNKELLTTQTPYIIEKAIKTYKDYASYDIIFEYAICMECHQQFISSYSSESLQNIQNYFIEHAQDNSWRDKLKAQLKEGVFVVEEWLARCMLKGTPKKALTEYQIGTQCIGDKMLVREMPFLIGEEAMNEITMLLSNATIDQMNGFIDSFFGLPPDLKKLLKESGVFVF